jgi:nucleoside-diphosphate-sugar epimerase
VLIIGCGDIGRRVAALCLARGEAVVGVVRSPDQATALERAGIQALRADLDQDPLPPLPSSAAGVLYLAPPPEQGSTDFRMGRVLNCFAAQGQPRRLVYLSTSGVYGDCRGAWVDETRPPHPQEERSRRRLDAERQAHEWSRRNGVELVILRVAGIYGPDRLPLARIRQGLPLVRAEEAPFTNRIHEDDLSRICLAAMDLPVAGELFNVSDGQPGTMADYFDRVADLAGLRRPPKIPLAQAAARLSPGMLSYMRESRRLDNRKLRERLGIELLYPNLEQGLAACFPPRPNRG